MLAIPPFSPLLPCTTTNHQPERDLSNKLDAFGTVLGAKIGGKRTGKKRLTPQPCYQHRPQRELGKHMLLRSKRGPRARGVEGDKTMHSSHTHTPYAAAADTMCNEKINRCRNTPQNAWILLRKKTTTATQQRRQQHAINI